MHPGAGPGLAEAHAPITCSAKSSNREKGLSMQPITMKPDDLISLLDQTKKAIAEAFKETIGHYVDAMNQPDQGRPFLQISTALEAIEGMVREAARLAVQQRYPSCQAFWGTNCASLVSDGTVLYDGLRFRSRTETRVYDALKRRKILFYPNATVVLGSTRENEKKETDFLICDQGRWGVLEVVSKEYHPSPQRDKERAKSLREFGVAVVKFFDADRCYNEPDAVIDEFLSFLRSVR
jgi:hypothetical protein